jgi:hypothetical protein
VFQDRYVFGKVSLVSFLGGRPVGMGIDIVTMGAICHEYRCSDVRSACELDKYFLFQIPWGVYAVI